jgi:hypothetical protein
MTSHDASDAGKPDDMSDDALFVRGMAAKVRRALKTTDGELVPGARELVRDMGNLFVQASKEPDPFAFLVEALQDDEDDSEQESA